MTSNRRKNNSTASKQIRKDAWRERLRKTFPQIPLKDDEHSLCEAAKDAWLVSKKPDVVAYPQDTDQVSQLLHFASLNGIPVTPRGSGTGYVGGCVPVYGGIVMDLSGMKKIHKIDTRNGIVIVQPGVITGNLQRRLERLGWFYPPDPASLDECTIGGNIATNAGGPRCLKYGVTKHYVLAVQVVLADGRVVRLGGATHKNKCGFDLVSLITGSEGQLAIVTEATLRIIPKPQTRAAVAATFPSARHAVNAMFAVFQSGILPSALEIVDDFTLKAARDYLGTKQIPEGKVLLIAEVDGNHSSVQSDLKTVCRIFEQKAAIRKIQRQGSQVDTDIWSMRRELSYSLRATGLTKFNQDIVVPRSKIVELFSFTEKLSRRHRIRIACFGHAGDGNIHVNLMVDMNESNAQLKVHQTLNDLFHKVLAWGGTITGEHGVGIARLPWWPVAVEETVRGLHNEIKSIFDPKGTLNPGKFVNVGRNKSVLCYPAT